MGTTASSEVKWPQQPQPQQPQPQQKACFRSVNVNDNEFTSGGKCISEVTIVNTNGAKKVTPADVNGTSSMTINQAGANVSTYKTTSGGDGVMVQFPKASATQQPINKTAETQQTQPSEPIRGPCFVEGGKIICPADSMKPQTGAGGKMYYVIPNSQELCPAIIAGKAEHFSANSTAGSAAMLGTTVGAILLIVGGYFVYRHYRDKREGSL